MKKDIKNLILSLSILILILLVFIPYFSSYLLDLRQIRESDTTYQELLKKQKELQEKNYLTGKFDPAYKKNFILIPLQYIYGGNNMYLRKETLLAFIKMQDAAALDNINLKIASATRNFDYQKNIV